MIDKKTGLWIYNKMHEIRDFEETAWTLFTENKLRGSVHLYTGEEAVAASVCAQLTDEDLIASTHRGHGHCIGKGAELDRALAELMGKATGYCNCQKCSGGYTKTYSGTIPKANHTLSADLNKFPIGTKLVINGITYTVEDKGSSVNGNKVDIFFETHAEALAFGTKTVDVFTAK